MENLSCYIVLVVPFVYFFFFFIFKHYSSSNLPPSPPALPLIGHLHLIRHSLHLSLASLSSRYGPLLYLRFGSKSILVVSSPSAVAECFTKNDVVFADRPRSVAADRLSYNYTAFAMSSYGDLWRTLRRLTVVEMFSSHSLQKLAKIRQQEMLKIARRICCKDEWQKVDLNNFISTYSFNVMMRCLTGESCVRDEDIGSEVGKESIERLKETFVPAIGLGFCDYFPVLRWIGYGGLENNLISLHKKRDELLQHLIDEQRMKFEGENLIGTLLSLQASDPHFYTDHVIKSILLILISAGTDTSAVTIEWAMSLLLSHPEELLKLKQEIDENIGHNHLLNDSDLVKLPYLGFVVKETLRLHPAAPLLLPHYSSHDCVVSGYNIPKGTILMVNVWAMHRDPDLWDEPDEFNPERFQGADMEGQDQKFLPFGMGRRACPGAAMALRTVSLALGTLVQCFEWRKPFEGVEMGFNADSRVTLRKAKPLEAMCIPRNQAAHLLSQL